LKPIVTSFKRVIEQLGKLDPEATNAKNGKKVAQVIGRLEKRKYETEQFLRNWCQDFEAQYDPPPPPPERRARGGRSRRRARRRS
jgi:hypothetical protein